jgi:hypothetical protein
LSGREYRCSPKPYSRYAIENPLNLDKKPPGLTLHVSQTSLTLVLGPPTPPDRSSNIYWRIAPFSACFSAGAAAANSDNPPRPLRANRSTPYGEGPTRTDRHLLTSHTLRPARVRSVQHRKFHYSTPWSWSYRAADLVGSNAQCVSIYFPYPPIKNVWTWRLSSFLFCFFSVTLPFLVPCAALSCKKICCI